jgi:hypothetical protein
VTSIFSADAVARAKKMVAAFKVRIWCWVWHLPGHSRHDKSAESGPANALYTQGGVGAYTDSRGNDLIRKEIANFIEIRDGYPANPDVSAPCCPCTYVSARARAHTHTHTHTHMHNTHTHAQTHTQTYTYTHIHTHVHERTEHGSVILLVNFTFMLVTC